MRLRPRGSVEIGDVRPDIANRCAVKRTERDANAVEHTLENLSGKVPASLKPAFKGV
jgi:hypothetical protein